jgi:mannose-6-phosphate isomerase
MPLILHNPVRSYAWGSTTVIPELLGQAPTGEPQAELWIGAHPGAPSTVDVDETRLTLTELIEKDPEGTLGKAVLDRFGPRLPFLLKILAIEQPLSIQAHPTKEQAEAGFAAEEAGGVPVDAPHRLYRDRSHKPEMVVALTDVKALLGFRPPRESAAVLDELNIPLLREYAEILRQGDPAGLLHIVRRWLLMPADEVAPLVAAIVQGARRLATELGPLIVTLGALYPGDRGVLLALLMRYERLRAGEAAFVAAGVPHAYLKGVAVEAQASSDNTLRAGLTPKHVDAAELARVLRYDAEHEPRLPPRPAGAGHVAFTPPADEFRLDRIALGPASVSIGTGDPRIVLITEGSAELMASSAAVRLDRGRAAFVPAADGDVSVTGNGVAFVVSPGAGVAHTAR